MTIIKADTFSHIKHEIPRTVPFIAFVVSSWHLDNLIAFLRLNDLQEGIAIVQPMGDIQDDSKYRLSAENFKGYEKLFSKVCFINKLDYGINVAAFIKYLFAGTKDSMYLIASHTRISARTVSRLLYLRVKFKYIFLDEGTGSYLPYKMMVLPGTRGYKYLCLKETLKQGIYLLCQPFLYRFCVDVSKFHLYRETKNHTLVCDDSISTTLRKIYTDRTYGESFNKKQDLIFILKDFRLFEERRRLEIYHYLLEYLQNTPYLIYIKKHPCDTNSDFDEFVKKYQNVVVLKTKKSAEELMPFYTPKFIIGDYTTALFSSADVFKIEAVSFIGLYLTYFKDIPDWYRKEITFFEHAFRDNEYLSFPATYDELFRELDKKCR